MLLDGPADVWTGVSQVKEGQKDTELSCNALSGFDQQDTTMYGRNEEKTNQDGFKPTLTLRCHRRMDFHWPPPPHDRWRRLWPPWPKPPWPSWWSSSWAASQARGAMGPQRLQVSKSRFTDRVNLWWWWLLMTGFWVHLNAQLTDPREPTAHAGKTPPPGTFGGCGSRDSGTAKPTQDAKVQRNAQHKPTKIPTNTERGVGIFVRRICCLCYRWISTSQERFVLWLMWLLFLLGGFSVSGCFVSAPLIFLIFLGTNCRRRRSSVSS